MTWELVSTPASEVPAHVEFSYIVDSHSFGVSVLDEGNAIPKDLYDLQSEAEEDRSDAFRWDVPW